MSTRRADAMDLVTGRHRPARQATSPNAWSRRDDPSALVRPSADTRFLETLGVELIRGDLTDPIACDRAVREVDTVYHAAAKVGDWGPWREFQASCIDATVRLARASIGAGIGRFVHISSTSRLRASGGGEPAG